MVVSKTECTLKDKWDRDGGYQRQNASGAGMVVSKTECKWDRDGGYQRQNAL